MTVLKKQDCLDAGFCILGQVRFCRLHGLDYRALEQHGIDVEQLAGINDLNLTLAIEKATAREAREGGLS